MQITFIIIFAAIFLINIICIIVFNKYNCDFIKKIDDKTLSIRFVLGFSTKCIDLLHRLPFIKKSQFYEKSKQQLSSLNTNVSAERSIYIHHIKLASYIISIILVSSFIGFAYSVSQLDKTNEQILEISRPTVGEGKQNISLITDSEAYSGTIEITVEDKKYSFDEAMDIFSSYRADFDNYVLGENSSFLHVTSPLNFPSTWGDECISVSWYISNCDIIDFSGNIVSNDLTEDGSSVEIVATLTLGEISADICYQIVVYPINLTSKDLLTSYVNEYINSDTYISDSTISLPSEYNGQAVYFFEEKEVYPSLDFYNCHCHFTYSNCTFREEKY